WNYSAEKRNEITELDISSKELEGDLSLENFTKLQKLNCANNQINRLDLSKSEQLVEVDCSMNKLIEINLKNSKNLLNLYCNDNQLTNLDLSSCENLESLKVHNSYNEEERDFLNKLPNPEKLKVLRLDANNVSSNLEPFSGFINLEDLGLGMNGYSKETTKKRGNKFYGSLEPLKNLNKLKKLDIANTDIDSGFEHLPASVEEICCSSKERSESKVKKIADDPKLNHLFDLNGNKYTRNWKDIHADFTPQLQKL
ncbi:18484_t:CDS:2, partial [Racocetra persica]